MPEHIRSLPNKTLVFSTDEKLCGFAGGKYASGYFNLRHIPVGLAALLSSVLVSLGNILYLELSRPRSGTIDFIILHLHLLPNRTMGKSVDNGTSLKNRDDHRYSLDVKKDDPVQCRNHLLSGFELLKFDFVFDFAPTAANDRMFQIFYRLVAHKAYTLMKRIVQLHRFLLTRRRSAWSIGCPCSVAACGHQSKHASQNQHFFIPSSPMTPNGLGYLISPVAMRTALPSVWLSMVNPKRAGVALGSTPIFSTSSA